MRTITGSGSRTWEYVGDEFGADPYITTETVAEIERGLSECGFGRVELVEGSDRSGHRVLRYGEETVFVEVI